MIGLQLRDNDQAPQSESRACLKKSSQHHVIIISAQRRGPSSRKSWNPSSFFLRFLWEIPTSTHTEKRTAARSFMFQPYHLRRADRRSVDTYPEHKNKVRNHHTIQDREEP